VKRYTQISELERKVKSDCREAYRIVKDLHISELVEMIMSEESERLATEESFEEEDLIPRTYQEKEEMKKRRNKKKKLVNEENAIYTFSQIEANRYNVLIAKVKDDLGDLNNALEDELLMT